MLIFFSKQRRKQRWEKWDIIFVLDINHHFGLIKVMILLTCFFVFVSRAKQAMAMMYLMVLAYFMYAKSNESNTQLSGLEAFSAFGKLSVSSPMLVLGR